VIAAALAIKRHAGPPCRIIVAFEQSRAAQLIDMLPTSAPFEGRRCPLAPDMQFKGGMP